MFYHMISQTFWVVLSVLGARLVVLRSIYHINHSEEDQGGFGNFMIRTAPLYWIVQWIARPYLRRKLERERFNPAILQELYDLQDRAKPYLGGRPPQFYTVQELRDIVGHNERRVQRVERRTTGNTERTVIHLGMARPVGSRR